MDTIEINIFGIVGSNFCVEAEDGDKVHELITKALNEKVKVEISFLNIDLLTTAFLNSAIGKLYKDFSEDDIKMNLSVKDLSRSGAVSLKRVVETAKLYFRYPEAMQKSINEILGD
jgi:hypothetical protein